MRRYAGEALSPAVKIALISFDALGNFVVATPIAQLLKQNYPHSRIDYFGGTRTRELAESSPWFEKVFDLFGSSPAEMAKGVEHYDWVVNLEAESWAKSFTAILAGDRGVVTGPCVNSDGRGDLKYSADEVGNLARDQAWLAPDIVAKYPFLASGFIGEIFCRLAYLEGPVPTYSVHSLPVARPTPDVIFAISASEATKLWPLAHWCELAAKLQALGVTVGLVGAKPAEQKKFLIGTSDEDQLVGQGRVEDWRGVLSLPQVVGLLGQAKLVVTLDNGILHLACATKTPVVGLYRHGIHRLWAPPSGLLSVVEPGPGRPVSGISVEHVLGIIKNLQ